MRSPRRQVAALAVLATALTAGLIPAAGTTAPSEVDRAAVHAALVAAYVDETRAWTLLAKRPPRKETAALVLDRSERRLKGINEALEGSALGSTLPGWVSGNIATAARFDNHAADRIRNSTDSISTIVKNLEEALRYKAQADAAVWSSTAASSSECSDGKDNDGDRLVDGRVDSGCTAGDDASESSALTCSLDSTTSTSTVVQGTCSGPFSKLELNAPTGVAFDTTTMPVVQKAQACRWVSERRLDCLMADGVANPQHVVSARFKLKRRSHFIAPALRTTIRDFRGRGRAQAVPVKPYLRFSLSYTHVGLSHVCASIVGTSGASLKLTLKGPNGQTLSGTLQLKKKAHATATGGFSFRILSFGIYEVTIEETVNGKSVTKTQTIEVTDAAGDSRCSATGAPPP